MDWALYWSMCNPIGKGSCSISEWRVIECTIGPGVDKNSESVPLNSSTTFPRATLGPPTRLFKVQLVVVAGTQRDSDRPHASF